MSENKGNSMNIGNIGGNLSVGGDIVGGDKVSAGGDVVYGDKNTATTSTAQIGFKSEQDKQQCLVQLEKLRVIVRKLRDELEDSDVEELAEEASAQIKTLKDAKEEAQALPTGEKAEAKQSKSIEDYFKTVSVFIDKAQKFGEKAGELTVKLAPWIEKAVPVLLSARKLIGLP